MTARREPWRSFVRRHAVEITLGVLVFVVHGYFYNGANWNQNARMDAIFAFVEPGYPEHLTFRIDRFVPDPGKGFNTGDWAKFEGHYYSNKAPMSSLLGIPPYFALYHLETWLGRNVDEPFFAVLNTYLINLWVSVLWVSISTVALFRYLNARWHGAARDALFVAAIYAFGTMMFPFDTQIWGHPTAAAFTLLAFVGLLADREGADARAGFWLGMAIATDYLCVFLAVAAVARQAQFSDRWKRLFRFGVGGAMPIAVLLAFHYYCFGDVFTTPTSLTNPIMMEQGKFAGLVGVPSLLVLSKLLFSPARGFFVYSPVFALTVRQVFTRVHDRVDRDTRLIFAFCSVVYFTLSSGYLDWTQGSCTGPRYLITLIPLWCLLLPRFSQLRLGWKVPYAVLAAVSFLNQLVIASVNTMVPADVENPWWQHLYRPFLDGRFPNPTWLTHSMWMPKREDFQLSTFNLGTVFLGWRGKASLVPLAAVVIVGSCLLWKYSRDARVSREIE